MQNKYAISQLIFNPAPPSVMHIDLNSCFASIEQQANPMLRGRSVAVAVHKTPNGCILAASIEAKRVGVKTGMRVKEGKLLSPDLVVLSPDPWKYRNVHLALRRLLLEYTPDLTPKSIDEFVLNFEKVPLLDVAAQYKDGVLENSPLKSVARQVKRRIRESIGDWLRVSVGISTNRFLAKLASNIHKPDGLDEINKDNFLEVFSTLELTSLSYIKAKNALRLNNVGIFSVIDFYNAPLWKLRAAFNSVVSYYWYLRIHGYEIDDIAFSRKSYGNSYVLPKPFSGLDEISPIISKLTEKMSFRLRRAGYMASGVHLAIGYRNGVFWHKANSFDRGLFESSDIYKKVVKVFTTSPYKFPVKEIFVSVYGLERILNLQLNFFEDVLRKRSLSKAVDKINERWGNFVISPARMLFGDGEMVPDRIAFGGVKELEEFTLNDSVFKNSG